ncbi:hypothetical protein [Limnoglobus roseus]|uniref:Zf-HC2 domain-containing protein n=1 Tax=Limnoglobus roseus TaxID=2598579 RepID=A0A5C1AKR3_9BACT|nr:hypothetical protein [Limnoglobus roseus]QEL17754.1 hypothetical protein PX52LOC_04758 [Limnoglobus roseus]
MICRTAVELVCRSVDVRLTRVERMGLAVHTFFCSPCRRFRGELLQLHHLWEADDAAPPSAATLSPEGRERISAAFGQSPPPA